MSAAHAKRSDVSAITPIDQSELEFDHGSFDSKAFTQKAMSNWQALAAVIDAALLNPDVTRDQVEKLCAEAVRYRFASALVQPVWVSTAVGVLAGTGIPVGVVLGFPFGASLTSTLRHEAASLLRLGARELDMVIPIGQLKSGNHQAVEHSIRAVAHVSHHHGAELKVTLETSMLTVQEKLRVAEIAIQAGADFIKTSTGFGKCGATVADVALMRGVAGGRCGVCGSGGIRTLANVKELLEAGANRICTSAAVPIVLELDAD
jgi:deoxyribose-phosphate aldolase